MKALNIVAFACLFPLFGSLGDEVQDKPNPPREGGNLNSETIATMAEVTKVTGEFKIVGAAMLPPCFVVGRTVKWRSHSAAVLPSQGSGRIKGIVGAWALIEILTPDNALGTWWVDIASAQLAWSAGE